MHYLVAGAGAIGCYVGGMLAAGGMRVSFLARPRAADLLRTQGLRVSSLEGDDTRLPASAFAVLGAATPLLLEAGEAATVLLCVKGGATAEAAREIAGIVRAGTPVLSLQNGVDNTARIRAAAPGLTAVAGMVPFNVIQPAPGHVHRATSGVLRAERCAATEAMLIDFAIARVPLQLHADMRAVQWGKLLLNLNNPVNALSGLPLREELRQQDYRRVLAALIAEALAALQAAGIKPARVSGAPPALLPAILRLPDSLFRIVAAPMLRIDPAARSSMWDDLQAGHVTEIDDLCGAVQRLGTTHDIAAPCNAALMRLVAAANRGTLYSGAQLLAACDIA